MTAGACGYVLAGGRSSRMGVNKAKMRLGGQTLLEIAIGKLRHVCGKVVSVGKSEHVPPGVRVIPDLHPGCGPMGGMEAALQEVNIAGDRAAIFLPVDMPLLPVDLLKRLAGGWLESSARVCFAVVDGRPQPLVSLLRWDVWGEIQDALERGAYKVRPVLEMAGGSEDGLLQSQISTLDRDAVWPGWVPEEAEWRTRELWFSNLNTPEEFAAAERLWAAHPYLLC